MAAGDGLVSMTPTSIAHSGTSASINADGGVDFTAVTSLSLNGVFTSDYDNYVVIMGHEGSAAYPVYARLRASGSDATGSNYTWQYILASSTSVSALRSADSYWLAADAATTKGGVTISIYGPALAQPTAFRKVDNYPNSGATIIDAASTHSLSTAYDGFSLIMLGGRTITGNVHVFGYEE
jgi:hypothetical protein